MWNIYEKLIENFPKELGYNADQIESDNFR